MMQQVVSMQGGRVVVGDARRSFAAARAPTPRAPTSRRSSTRVRASHNAEEEEEERRAVPSSPLLPSLPREPAGVGSHHGEGFVQLTAAGVTRVDVESLNDALRSSGAMRLRHAQKPDEAFGMVFSFDGVIADLTRVRADAWAELARLRGLPPPSAAVLRSAALHALPSEVVAVRVLGWASDRRSGQELAAEHARLAGGMLLTSPTLGDGPRPGVREWLDALARFRVPCALASSLDRATLRRCLERLTLHDHFDALVAAEDEAETLSQRLLVAAMKLGRPPNMCVAFEATPEGVTAAHNVTMKAVGVVTGRYRAYELAAADVTCPDLSQLAVYNVRRLFSNAGAEFMDLQRQAAKAGDDDDGSSSGGGQRRRRITNATL